MVIKVTYTCKDCTFSWKGISGSHVCDRVTFEERAKDCPYFVLDTEKIIRFERARPGDQVMVKPSSSIGTINQIQDLEALNHGFLRTKEDFQAYFRQHHQIEIKNFNRVFTVLFADPSRDFHYPESAIEKIISRDKDDHLSDRHEEEIIKRLSIEPELFLLYGLYDETSFKNNDARFERGQYLLKEIEYQLKILSPGKEIGKLLSKTTVCPVENTSCNDVICVILKAFNFLNDQTFKNLEVRLCPLGVKDIDHCPLSK